MGATPQQHKLWQMTGRMIHDFQDEIKRLYLDGDSLLSKYEKDANKAKAEQKFLTASIALKQYEHRKQDLEFQWAAKKMQEYANNGKLAEYMSDEDKEKFTKLRLMLFVLYDSIDSALKDMTDFYFSIGFSGVELKMLNSVKEARAAIAEWYEYSAQFDKETLADESDKIYETLYKRLDIIKRKSDKAKAKGF